jgi:hypothetical protein
MALDPARALGWRLRRHSLDPSVATTAIDVVGRVLAVRGWPGGTADLAVCVRQAKSGSGELERALDAGDLVQSYAFRGGSYVFTPDIAALVLSARTVTRIWETRRWQHQGGFELDDWEPLREELCAALADGPLTREQIAARLAQTGLRHLADAAAGAGADCLYKPLHWWGDICFGPRRDGASTFRLLRGDPRWPGPTAIEDAGPELVARYLHAYGPATPDNLSYWLTAGLGVPRRRLQEWLTDLGEVLARVTLDGTPAYVLEGDLDAMHAAEPSQAVRLLPAFDPWILGPGTADAHLVAPDRRAGFSRGANPVVWRGVVAGTWRLEGDTALVSWFGESGDAPRGALEEAAHVLARIRSRDLTVAVSTI